MRASKQPRATPAAHAGAYTAGVAGEWLYPAATVVRSTLCKQKVSLLFSDGPVTRRVRIIVIQHGTMLPHYLKVCVPAVNRVDWCEAS